jgi:hypothetical protein
MAPKSRSCHTSSSLVLLFFLAVSSTAISYPLHQRDVNRRNVDTVEAPSILNINSEQQPPRDQDTPTKRYVRLDDVTERLDDTEVVIPAYRQDSTVTSADEDGGLDSEAWEVSGVADAVTAAVKEISAWRERLGRKIWAHWEGEGNVIGGRQGDL